jgi:hypothetical protein
VFFVIRKGNADYALGDLTRQAVSRFTGKDEYSFGDLTRAVIGRIDRPGDDDGAGGETFTTATTMAATTMPATTKAATTMTRRAAPPVLFGLSPPETLRPVVTSGVPVLPQLTPAAISSRPLSGSLPIVESEAAQLDPAILDELDKWDLTFKLFHAEESAKGD